MKRKISQSVFTAIVSMLIMGSILTSCKQEQDYLLGQEDIQIVTPDGGFTVKTNQLLRVKVNSVSDEGVSYTWFLDNEQIAQSKSLEYMFETAGEYELTLRVSQAATTFHYTLNVTVESDNTEPDPGGTSAYITKVFDFIPAVGQFTNALPKYEDGDTQQAMNAKVLRVIGNNNKGMISLGGFGGYVVVGFDHTINNVAGKRDFRITGNAIDAADNPDPNAPAGGSCEPGVVMVAYDANQNGMPDDEWYEIAGSAHEDHEAEPWYEKAKSVGNDVNMYFDYEITYYRPDKEPTTPQEKEQYIRWEDNKGNSGYKAKNQFQNQCYFPMWTIGDQLTFKGTRLPQNSIDESGDGSYYVLYKFRYGYADNATNTEDDSAIDISWAVDSNGQKIDLPGVDFIKIYSGVNQQSGRIGECSTEITGVEDLHVLGVDIDTRK